eukprot:3936872-Rhodomonas_salina.4
MDDETCGVKRAIKKKIAARKEATAEKKIASAATIENGSPLQTSAPRSITLRSTSEQSFKLRPKSVTREASFHTSKVEAQDAEEIDELFVCFLKQDAPREAKRKWLLRIGEYLKFSGAIALPLLKWNGSTKEEQNVRGPAPAPGGLAGSNCPSFEPMMGFATAC